VSLYFQVKLWLFSLLRKVYMLKRDEESMFLISFCEYLYIHICIIDELV
jgi:hypothetical protein